MVGKRGPPDCHTYQSCPGRDQGGGGQGEWDRGKDKKETKTRLCVFVHSPYWFINDKLMA